MIDGDHTIGPLRRMKALLKENRIISITVTPAASHVDEFEFLGGALKLPRGPIELAQSTGAALLPVFTVGARAVPKVEISPSVSPPSRDPESIAATERSVVSWLKNCIEVHPSDWIGWRADLFVSAASSENSVPSVA